MTLHSTTATALPGHLAMANMGLAAVPLATARQDRQSAETFAIRELPAGPNLRSPDRAN